MKNIVISRYIILLFMTLSFANVCLFGQTECIPTIQNILNDGWDEGANPSNPTNHNYDEFGIYNSILFIVKASYYPPIRSFPKTDACSYFYMSFDNNQSSEGPVNYTLQTNELNDIVTYLPTNTIANYFKVYPPSSTDVNNVDFIVNIDGTNSIVAWDMDTFKTWTHNKIIRNQGSVNIINVVDLIGADTVRNGANSMYTANVNGGTGYYGFQWKYREKDANGAFQDWIIAKSNMRTDKYFIFGVNEYWFYKDEHTYTHIMSSRDTEIKVIVYYYNTSDTTDIYQVITATKYIKSDDPLIQFTNRIDVIDTCGFLIIDEEKNNPVPSNSLREVSNNSEHSIRTDLLPFEYNWDGQGGSQKHINWLNEINSSILTLDFSTEGTAKLKYISHFEPTYPATIQYKVDGYPVSFGEIEFKDPWYYYENPDGSWSQSDTFIEYISPVSLFTNSQGAYGGVFKEKNPQFLPNQKNYSIRIELIKSTSLNGAEHKLYFEKWEVENSGDVFFEDENSTETAVVFKESGAVINAVAKGTQLSSHTDAFTNTSQRKAVRTANGNLHMVYESMNRVWYEYSTDNGATWQLGNSAQPLSYLESKNPSIYSGTLNGDIVITYQEDNPNNQPYHKLRICSFNNGSKVFDEVVSYQNFKAHPAPQMKPVIAVSDLGNFCVIATGKMYYEQNYNTYAIFGSIMGSTFTTNNTAVLTPGTIYEACVVASELGEPNGTLFDVIYHANSSGVNSIVHRKYTYDNPSYQVSYPADPSFGTNVTNISSPSLWVLENDFDDPLLVIGWIYDNNGIDKVLARYETSSGTWSSPVELGTDVVTVQVSAPDNLGSGYLGAVAWQEINGTVKAVRLTSGGFTGETTVSSGVGSFSLSSGGSSADKFNAYILKTDQQPYEIQQKNIPQILPATISSDYTIASGTYELQEDLTIYSGATVTIEPGVTIKIGIGNSIWVEGKIIAEGTLSNPIHFKCLDPDTLWNRMELRGDYSKLEYCVFEKGRVPIFVKSRHNVIKHCTMRKGMNGFYTWSNYFGSGWSSFVMDSCLITDNVRGAVLKGTSGGIRHTKIVNSDSYGLYLDNADIGEYDSNEEELFTNNIISNNGEQGVKLWRKGWLYLSSDIYKGHNKISQNSGEEIRLDNGAYLYGPSYLKESNILDGGYNDIYDSTGGYLIYNLSRSYTYTVSQYVRHNYWGNSSGPPDSSLNTSVIYQPYETSPQSENLGPGHTPTNPNADASDFTGGNNSASMAYDLKSKMLRLRNKIYLNKKAPDCFKKLIELYRLYAEHNKPGNSINLTDEKLILEEVRNTLYGEYNSMLSANASISKSERLLAETILILDIELMLEDRKYDKALKTIAKSFVNIKNADNIRGLLTQKFTAYENLQDYRSALSVLDELEALERNSGSIPGYLPPSYETEREHLKMLLSEGGKSKTSGTLNDNAPEILSPDKFYLDQNYPNPFNPMTVIKFGIPENSRVKLVVFDVLGRQVAELLNEEKTAGKYSVNFNASRLASGVYIYRIEAGRFAESKKMILMK